jgi:hypothetical protein
VSANGDVREVEAMLLLCAAKARARGLDIIYGAFEEHDGDELIGVCALGAYNACSGGEHLALPEGDALSDAWDAIEIGFDDGMEPAEDTGLYQWWEVGQRLRAQLNPREARS